MKTSSSLILSIYLLFVQASQETHGRYLQQAQNDENNNFGEFKNELSYRWGNASAQINEDLNGMWETTPSEWGDEYWEIFVGLVGIALSITFCLMLICCTPCCRKDYAEQRPLYVTTREEMDSRRRMNQPILEQGTEHRGRHILPRPADEPKRATDAPADEPKRTTDDKIAFDQSALDPPMASASTHVSMGFGRQTEGSQIPQKRRRRTLWEETIIVWKDFFRNGMAMYVPENDDMSYYTSHDDKPRRKTRSSSERKRKSSSRTGARRKQVV